MPFINSYFAGQGHCPCDSTAPGSLTDSGLAPSNSYSAGAPSMTAWAWFAGLLVAVGLAIPKKGGRR